MVASKFVHESHTGRVVPVAARTAPWVTRTLWRARAPENPATS
jgi:hypothetical protein